MKPVIRTPLALLLLALLLAPATRADTRLPGALVEPDWLMAQSGNNDLLILDIQEPPQFARHHLPGAINWPFSQWRSGATAKPPKSILPLDELSAKLGKLGIAATTPIVIVATGSGPISLSTSARVFWTLKVLGHGPVTILDGGLVGYVNDHRGAYVSGTSDQAEARPSTDYQAKPRPELLATADWIKDVAMPRLDARSQAEYVGLVSGGKGERPGTLADAHHLPFDWLADNNSGRLRPTAQLQTLFQYAGLGDQAAVHFCHTGNRAALTWFVDYALLGHQGARLYDGSMMEWSRDAGLPIEQKLSLPTAR